MKAEKKIELTTVNGALKLAVRDLRDALITAMRNAESMRDADTLCEIVARIRRVEKAVDDLNLMMEFL